MAVRVKVKVNSPGVREMLRGDIGKAAITPHTERIGRTAGPGHEVEYFRGRNRWRGTVRTTTDEAAINEQAHKTLTNALRASR